jgi:glucose-6-phosphate isomerase
MANDALRHYARRDLTFPSVSNIDGTDFVEVTRDIDAEQTLFIISSKTFRVGGRCSRDSAIGMSERLTPAALGTFVALYEHSVFTHASSTNALMRRYRTHRGRH